MWPWGHAAVGYLLYTAMTWYRNDRPPEPHPLVWLLFGTQFPDLVDKPLVWYVDVLPYGRSLAHSLIIIVPLGFAIYLVYQQRGRSEYAGAFTIGAVSHAIVDVPPAIVTGEYELAYVLLWPLLPLAVRPEPGSLTGHLLRIDFTPYFLFQIVLAMLAAVVWQRDGMPGFALVRDIPRSLSARLSR